jgi:hypothetical protein
MLLVPALNVRSARGPAYDSDALAYCRASGATDRKAISDFVRGVKNLGLWNNMVCWPLRSTQNAGTGTTAYSLGGLGTFNGTLVNGPTWGANGITFVRASSQRATTTLANRVDEDTFVAAVGQSTSVDTVLFSSRLGNGGSEVWAPVGSGLSLIARNFSGGTANALVNLVWPTAGTLAYVAANFGTRNTDKAFTEGSVNAANYISSTAAGSGGLSIGGFWTIGGYDTFPVYTGLVAFCCTIRGNVTQNQNAAFNTLYKQTLGTGLGLP